jgi:hypothetical protein
MRQTVMLHMQHLPPDKKFLKIQLFIQQILHKAFHKILYNHGETTTPTVVN